MVDRINSRERLSDVSKQFYCSIFRKHIQDKIDYENDDPIDIIQQRTINLKTPTRINVLKCLHHITGDERYRDGASEMNFAYKSRLMATRVIEPIDWIGVLSKLYQKVDCTVPNNETVQMWIQGLLMCFHPRRFGDYYNLRVGDIDFENNKIKFTKFKNSASKTCGEKEVVMHPKVRTWLLFYLQDHDDVEERIFSTGEKARHKYLMRQYGLPLTNANRKFQENRDINEGKDYYETAKRFNHALGVQSISYLQRQANKQ
jgi:integrase